MAGILLYTTCTFFIASLVATGAVLSFSAIGYGFESYNTIHQYSWLKSIFSGAGIFLLLCLYLADYFLGPDDEVERQRPQAGNIIFLIAVGNILLAVVFSVDRWPYLPLLAMLFGPTPILMGFMRRCLKPRKQTRKLNAEIERIRKTIQEEAKSDQASAAVANFVRVDEGFYVAQTFGRERERYSFFVGAASSFFLAAVLVLVLWLYWIYDDEFQGKNEWSHRAGEGWRRSRGDAGEPSKGYLPRKGSDQSSDTFSTEKWGNNARMVLWLLYTAPLVCVGTFVFFAAALLLRSHVQAEYARGIKYQEELARVVALAENERGAPARNTVEQAQAQESAVVLRLLVVVRVVVCCFTLLATGAWMSAAVAGAQIQAAGMVMGYLFWLFVGFSAFLFATLRRVASQLVDQLTASPFLQQIIHGVRHSNVGHAITTIVLGAFVPFLMLLSTLNQRIREKRMGRRSPPSVRVSGCWLTPRVAAALNGAREWNWLGVMPMIHYVCLVVVLFQVGVSKVTTIALAWVNNMLQGLGFGTIVFCFYLVGIGFFLCPPIPGVPVYILGGVVITANAPEEWGFWGGACFASFLGIVLKASAITLQQKWIGEGLSRSDWVRAAVGVNKPMMRAIEIVLKRPGMSLGKVAILCGGPDWPTSVLTGLLRLSLPQMLLGSVPVIIFVISCTFSGAVVLKKQESPVWEGVAAVVLALTSVIGAFFMVTATYTVQVVMESHSDEIRRPQYAHVDLDWLCYKGEQVSQAVQQAVQWNDCSKCSTVSVVGGAILNIASIYIFVMQDKSCFGYFDVNTPIDELTWEFVKPLGWVATFLCVVGSCGLVIFNHEVTRLTRPARQARIKELEDQEASWKDERRRECLRLELEHQKAEQARSLLPPLSISSSVSREMVRRFSGSQSGDAELSRLGEALRSLEQRVACLEVALPRDAHELRKAASGQYEYDEDSSIRARVERLESSVDALSIGMPLRNSTSSVPNERTVNDTRSILRPSVVVDRPDSSTSGARNLNLNRGASGAITVKKSTGSDQSQSTRL